MNESAEESAKIGVEMAKFFSIGEALIDMIPREKGVSLKEVTTFTRTAGGAPANVCAAVAKQGVDATFIGKIGADAFGDFLIDTMSEVGINTDHVFRTKKANTSLAFVSLMADGERDFSFYRKPGADMLLDEVEICGEWFGKGDYLHFGTVDLIEAPVKYAHQKTIELVKSEGGTIVFDPNLRFPLWEDKDNLRKTVHDFSDYADIIKISDIELRFICGTDDVVKAADYFLNKGTDIFIYTMGKDGARLITKNTDVFYPAFKVAAIDATGAGDAFIGAMISFVINSNVDIKQVDEDCAKDMLKHACACGAIVATKHGAIQAMPTNEEVQTFLNKQ